ncbi:MAG: hypothetical protein IT366_01270 [Candidatus Hydrogenedentes bacterium]|nr:hypothetical protein [Candidatus Hydrogenedentota bacterium]
MKGFQKSWAMWALVVLVAITLFGPSMVAHAAAAEPSQALLEVIRNAFGDCGRVMSGEIH